jgi:pimeloyl-ACP methyl ester carboxylesterase
VNPVARLIISPARPAAPWAARRAGDDYGASAEPGWREVDWRNHLREVVVDDRRANYVDFGGPGDGPTVVLVHGLGGCWQNWLENIRPIAEAGRRVVAVDLPGFGESEMPADEITIPGYGRWLESFCDAVSLDRIQLVGHSMGGFISAECAIHHPERVERLVLASAAGISVTDLRRQPLLSGARVYAALAQRLIARSETIVARPRLRTPLWGYMIRHPRLIRADLLYEVTHGSGRPAFLPALSALTDYDFRERLAEIRCPTLIVWGDQDMLVPMKDADEFERLIPKAQKIVFDDTGHMVMFERTDRFDEAVIDFLAQSSGDDSAGAREADEGREAAAV